MIGIETTCTLFAISVGFFHDVREDTTRNHLESTYPQHTVAIKKAYSLPIEWDKDRVVLFTKNGCLNEKEV